MKAQNIGQIIQQMIAIYNAKQAQSKGIKWPGIWAPAI